ncbi:MAG: hypothetical protein EAZ51_05740 [Sphingobacteriales bacterium]|nr:MAG: hypothetical protein EAZ64_01915 [Sphingobacteriales bacterium]TAF80595.1 MAG: hypothetical protein EAZ51_05740 [Sphingobacteriales bacterium]
MIKLQKYYFTLALLFTFLSAVAQSTTNSPYSKFGLGTIKGAYLAQNKGMGNLAFGISSYGGYQNINVANPASYSNIRLTTFDIGARAEIQNLTKGSVSEKGFNGSLSHFVFAIPVTKKSALSFGLLPYSNLGYNFTNASMVDTFSVEHIYRGEGGLAKAYLGYGIKLGKHFSVGANVTYLFGNLKQSTSTEFSKYVGFLNSRKQIENSVGGIVAEYGLQYVTALNKKTKLTIGYAGNLKSNLQTTNKILYTRYQKNISTDRELASDTTKFQNNISGKMVLPSSNNFGFSIERVNHWLIGADLRTTRWSELVRNDVNQNLNNSWGVSVGGQITPDINAVSNYLALIDYRVGFNFDKTFMHVSQTDIKSSSLNVGLGLPLLSARTTFYKINIATEIGKRGTTDNNLVKEKFINIHIGFTINDRWFQKYKFD